MTTRQCVITGLGYVGAYGCGRSELARALETGEIAASEVEANDVVHPVGRNRHALLLRGTLEKWLDPRAARRLSPASKYAVAASHMALSDASLQQLQPDESVEASVHIATALGPTSSTEALLEQIFCESPDSASPLHFMESVANAPAAQVAIALRATGPNSSVTQREAGGLLAVCQGARDIVDGRAGRSVVGSVDELTSLTHAIFDRYDALATSDATGPMARPFDRDRDGFIMAEGAAAWLLEDEELARSRNARVLGRVVATVRANDPTASSTDWGTGGERLALTLSRGLARQGVDPNSIDAWISSASGSRAGDTLDASIYRQLFSVSAKKPALLAPKAIVGEYGGGFLAASVMAIEGATFGPTRGFCAADPALEVTPYDGSPRDRAALDGATRFLLSALAVGGAASWMVVDRVRG